MLLIRALVALLLLVDLSFAQSSPGLVLGQTPTAAQWNSYFAAKQDYPISLVSAASFTVGPGTGGTYAVTSGTAIQCAGNASYLTTYCMQPVFDSTHLLGVIVVPTLSTTLAGNANSQGPGAFTAQFDVPQSDLKATMLGNPWGFGANITSAMTAGNTNGVDGPLAFAATVKNTNGGNAKIFGWDWQFSNVGNALTNFGGVMGMSMNVAGQASVGIRMVSQGSQQITTGWDCQQGGAVGNGGYAWGCVDAGGNAIRNVTEYHFALPPVAGVITPASPFISGNSGNNIQFFGKTNGTGLNSFQFFTSQTTATGGTFQILDNSVDSGVMFSMNGATSFAQFPKTSTTIAVGANSILNDTFGLTATLQILKASRSILSIGQYSANANAPYISFIKSHNNSLGGITTVSVNDGLLYLSAQGYDATGSPVLQEAGNIQIAADAAPTAGSVAGRIVFQVAPSGGSSAEILRLNSNGTIKFSNAATFSANGAVATVLGSVGPTGSHTTVQKWFTIVDSTGATLYIPAF